MVSRQTFRGKRSGPKPRTVLGVVVVLLLVTSLAPTRFVGWVTAFQGPVQTVVGPVSGTLLTVASWLRPAVRGPRETPDQAEALRQRDLAIQRLQQANREIEGLRERLRVVDQFRGATVAPATPRVADVVGRELGAGAITIRGGRLAGFRRGMVVVDDASLQLIGRITRVNATTATVRLITSGDGAAGSRWVRGVVFDSGAEVLSAEEQAALPRVDLRPSGDGGFESAEVEEHPNLAAGGLVKLDDAGWPREAQLLELGVVEGRLEIDHPLMTRVRVRPRIDDLGLVSRVVVLMPEERDVVGARSAEGGGGGADEGGGR